MKGKGRQQRIHRRGPEQGKLEEHRFDVGQDMSTILVQENRGSAVKKKRSKKKKKKKRKKKKRETGVLLHFGHEPFFSFFCSRHSVFLVSKSLTRVYKCDSVSFRSIQYDV